jgi:hypothetical protein
MSTSELPGQASHETPHEHRKRIDRQNASGMGIFFMPVFGAVLVFLLYPLFAVVFIGTVAGIQLATGAINSGTDTDLAHWAVILLPALIAGAVALRIEQRLGARFTGYRVARHLVRLLIIGLIVNRAARTEMGMPDEWNPLALVADTFSRLDLGLITVVPMLIVHLMLVKWQPVREFWHGCLAFFFLRSTALEESYERRTVLGTHRDA